MNTLIQLKKITPLCLIVFALGCFAFSPKMQATPAPEIPTPNPPAPGVLNTRDGQSAMPFVTTGFGNSAFGAFSLFSNTAGNGNTAVGVAALDLNNANNNTAVGVATLLLNTGDFNTAVGGAAGINNDTGSNNIYIGDAGLAGESNVIAIGNIASSGTAYTDFFVGGVFDAAVDTATAVPVLVDDTGKLGTVPVATAPGRQGARNQAMLNKSGHSKFEELQATVAQQQRQIEVLTTQLKEQAAQIQKVSARLEASKPAPQVANNP
jgi:hypothetical protein